MKEEVDKEGGDEGGEDTYVQHSKYQRVTIARYWRCGRKANFSAQNAKRTNILERMVEEAHRVEDAAEGPHIGLLGEHVPHIQVH